MTELTKLSLADAAQGLQGGDFSSRELTQAYIARIEQIDPKIHAFLTLRRTWRWRKPSGPISD